MNFETHSEFDMTLCLTFILEKSKLFSTFNCLFFLLVKEPLQYGGAPIFSLYFSKNSLQIISLYIYL